MYMQIYLTFRQKTLCVKNTWKILRNLCRRKTSFLQKFWLHLKSYFKTNDFRSSTAATVGVITTEYLCISSPVVHAASLMNQLAMKSTFNKPILKKTQNQDSTRSQYIILRATYREGEQFPA